MSYATRSDVELCYGRDNIAKWADLDNLQDPATITARIEWALLNSYNLLNGKLLNGHYTIPFTEPYPQLIIYAQSLWAGQMLFDARMITDANKRDQLSFQRAELRNLLKQLHRGQTKLEGIEAAGTKIPIALVATEEEDENA